MALIFHEIALSLGGMRKRDADLLVAVLHQAGAIERVGALGAEDIGLADLGQRDIYDA